MLIIKTDNKKENKNNFIWLKRHRLNIYKKVLIDQKCCSTL